MYLYLLTNYDSPKIRCKEQRTKEDEVKGKLIELSMLYQLVIDIFMSGTEIELKDRQIAEIHKEDAMKFQEKWDAIWMAITFAEAGEQGTATSIYNETWRRADKRVADRPVQRPRQRL
jgi:hypothetical protein